MSEGNFLSTDGPLTRRAALQILLEECYRDGKVDPNKDGTLPQLARVIGVETQTARRIARSARRRAAAGELGPRAGFDPHRVYERAEVLAQVDGVLQEREIAILERLRKVLRLPPLHPEPTPDPDATPRHGLPQQAVARAPLLGPQPHPAPRPAAAPGDLRRVKAAPRPPAATLSPGRRRVSPAFSPLERVPALAEAGQFDEIRNTVETVVAASTQGPALERAVRHALADALKRVEARPELDDPRRLVAVAHALADSGGNQRFFWVIWARAACRLARELARRTELDAHAALLAELAAHTDREPRAVVGPRARALRDAVVKRFEARQAEEGWAALASLRALAAAAPSHEGVARELAIAVARALLSPDAPDVLASDFVACAKNVHQQALAQPRDLALVRRALAAGPVIAPLVHAHGDTDALSSYLTDLIAISEYWPGHEVVYAGIAKACEKVVVLSTLKDPADQRTPALGIAVLKTLRRAAPSSAGVADALVMVAAQTGLAVDFAPTHSTAAAPLHRLHEDVRAIWQAGEELAALPDDADVRAHLDRLIPDSEARLAHARDGEPSDDDFVIDLLHEIERQMGRCTGSYWTAREDWLRGVLTEIGENGTERPARLASSICERLCWPEPF